MGKTKKIAFLDLLKFSFSNLAHRWQDNVRVLLVSSRFVSSQTRMPCVPNASVAASWMSRGVALFDVVLVCVRVGAASGCSFIDGLDARLFDDTRDS